MRAVAATILFTLGLATAAAAGELVELKDGRLVEVDAVAATHDGLVLHLAPEADGARTQMRVDVADLDLAAAVRAWGAALDVENADAWTRLATFARDNGLFDLAEQGLARAAEVSEDGARRLEEFRTERPAEESRYHFERACDAFRARTPALAAEAARACIAAHEGGADAAMARELLELVEESEVASSPSQARADAKAARELERLEAFAARGQSRLAGPVRGSRAAALHSATRLLGDVSARLASLIDAPGPDDVRRRASELRDEVDAGRVSGLLHLADLALDAGAERSALSAAHDVLALRPDDPLALDIRQRALDAGQREQTQERAAAWAGARRTYHPYPYVARDVHSGIGLVPTWDPVRGLGRIPYSGRWWRGDGAGVVVVRRDPRLR